MKKRILITVVALAIVGIAARTLINLQTQVQGVLPVANGGTGTASPSLVGGTNVTITGSWPNQTVAATGGSGGGGLSSCAAASASGTAYTCTASPTIGSLTAGLTVAFKADVANTGSATLNVSSLGAKTIDKNCGLNALSANDLTASAWVLLVYDGTNWEMQNQPCQAALPSFSWDNQSGATATDTNGTEQLVYGGTASGLTVRYTSAPATPYTLTTQIVPNFTQASTSQDRRFGLAFRDSGTGKIIDFEMANNTSNSSYLVVDNFTTTTTFSADAIGPTTSGLFDPITGRNAPTYGCYRIRDDGTNLSFWYSVDCQNFFQFGSNLSRTAFMASGPNQIGWQVHSSTSTAKPAATLMKWTVTSP